MSGGASGRNARANAWMLVAYAAAIAAAVGAGWLLEGQHPLVVVALADVVGTLVIFGFSRAFDNSSFYDAYWSVAPPLIVAHAAWLHGIGDHLRPIFLATVLGVWALRLTYNWWRQWEGLGHEDWRYRDLRAKHGRLFWLVSFSGIHFFPTVLVFAGCLAVGPVFTSTAELGWIDALALALGCFGVWIESTADRQLHRHVRSGGPREAILSTGVWGWCRNPNYLGELSVWFSVALFGAAADLGAWWIWIGPLAMTLLFVGISIPMKEKRMAARRPGFADHQRRVPMLLPFPRRGA